MPPPDHGAATAAPPAAPPDFPSATNPTRHEPGVAAADLEPVQQLGDFTATVRVVWITALAVVIGAIGAVIALALLRLIGLFTNLFFFGRGRVSCDERCGSVKVDCLPVPPAWSRDDGPRSGAPPGGAPNTAAAMGCLRGVSVKMRMMVLVLLAFGVACQKSPAQTSATTAAKPPAPVASAPGQVPAPAAPPAVKPVPAQLPATIARVNGEAIDKSEFEQAIKNLEARAGQPVPADRRAEVYRGLLDQMIAYKLLLQQSKALKIAVPDADIDSRVKQIQAQFPNEQAFTKALSDQHVTIDRLKKEQRDQLLIAKVIDTEITPKVSVTPKDVDDFYAKNTEKFKEPENIHAQHVLIRVPENADAATKAKAKAEAEAILKQIRGGADFATVAKQKSQDPGSAPGGGDLGSFARGQMVPQFEEAAFKLKPGQVSSVVETPYGFHIIKVLEHKAARTVPLEEARPQLTEMLKQQQANQKADAYIAALKSKSKIDIYI